MIQKTITEIILIDENELFLHAQNKHISKIDIHDVRNQDLVRMAHILILMKDGDRKLLKSRW